MSFINACLSFSVSCSLAIPLFAYGRVGPSVCLSVHLFVYLSICLSICPSVCLFVCLFVCLYLRATYFKRCLQNARRASNMKGSSLTNNLQSDIRLCLNTDYHLQKVTAQHSSMKSLQDAISDFRLLTYKQKAIMKGTCPSPRQFLIVTGYLWQPADISS